MMPRFYDLMKYARTGIASPDMTGFDKLRARAAFGGYPVRTITGVPPISFKGDGKPLTAWSIAGNGQQTGTPTPDAPIMPDFCGVRTGNLFDKNGTDTSNGYESSKYIGWDEKTGNSANHNISEYISIPDGTTYMTISNVNASTTTYCQFYNSTKTAISIFRYNEIPKTVSVPNNAKFIRCSVAKIQMENFMLNTGGTALPYEPYGWKIPITNAGQTVPIYLGEVPTVRRIRKLVLDGTENWREQYNGFALSVTKKAGFRTIMCTHYKETGGSDDKSIYCGSTNVIIVFDSSFAALTDFKSYLAQQYAAGTPVTIWYALAKPQTAIVNEPLCKIGDYCDELHSTDAGVTIQTAKGENVLTVDTELQPSSMTITGNIKPL